MSGVLPLLLLVVALATGIVTVAVLGALDPARRTLRLRALTLEVGLFNLLVLAGLVYRSLGLLGPATRSTLLPGLLVVLALLKLAWLAAYVAVARALVEPAVEPEPRRVALAAALAFAISAFATIAGWWSGRESVVRISNEAVEILTLSGALAASAWLLARARRAEGRRRASMVAFGGFRLGVFGLMTAGSAALAGRPELAERVVPIGGGLLMTAFNAFPLYWVRRFAALPPATESGALDRYGISKREREVASLLASGLTNREIADRLFISLATVKDHNSSLFRKTGARNRVELVNLLRE